MKVFADWRKHHQFEKAKKAVAKKDWSLKILPKVLRWVKAGALVILLTSCQMRPAMAVEVNLDIIAQIESSNNPLAYNQRTGASGMYQFMPIAWLDVQNNFPELRQYPFSKAYEPRVARLFAKAYFILIDRYLRHYGLKTSLSNQLSCYNQGIGLTRKGILSKETRNYIAKYLKLARSK